MRKIGLRRSSVGWEGQLVGAGRAPISTLRRTSGRIQLFQTNGTVTSVMVEYVSKCFLRNGLKRMYLET